MEPLLLLHGAIGSSVQLQSVATILSQEFKTYAFNFAGHGGRELPHWQLSIELFAEEVITYMNAENLEKVSIFGYSMGGYVGMYIARHYPDRINKLITLATKYEWNEAIAANEVKKLDPEKTEQKVPAFAETLRLLHAPADWKSLMVKTAEMMQNLGRNNPLKTEDFEAIKIPVLLMLGDRDKMVTINETLAIYKALTDAQLAILPYTSHPLEQTDADTIFYMINKFMQVTGFGSK